MAVQQPVPIAPVCGIRPPPPVCLDTNCAENWRYFKQKWLNYAVITNLANQSRQYQVALLLHVMGDQALKIYNGFNCATTEDNRSVHSVDEILAKFDQFAIGEINEIYERYVFNNRDQHESETFESYVTYSNRANIVITVSNHYFVTVLFWEFAMLQHRNCYYERELLR